MSHQSTVRAARLAIERGLVLENEYMLSSKRLIFSNSCLLPASIGVESPQTQLLPGIITPVVSLLGSLESVLPPILANGPSIPLVTGNVHSIIEVELPGPGVDTPPPSIGNRNTTNSDNSGQVFTVNVPVLVDDFQRLYSRVTLQSTKVLMNILSFGERALQSESNCCHRHEARSCIDDDGLESWFIAIMHVSLVRIFISTLKSSKILEHWSVEMMLVFT